MALLCKPSKPASAFYLGIMVHSPHRVVAWNKYLPIEVGRDLRGDYS
jgi:hypothetical protein